MIKVAFFILAFLAVDVKCETGTDTASDYLQNTSTMRYFTRNEDDFLRFERDGDIRLITVDSLISQTIVSVMPAENTTVEQSSGGFIVLKTQNGEIVVVNATNGSVTVYSHNVKVEVDTVLRNVSVTGADDKIFFNCNISQSDIDGIKTIVVNIEEDKKHINCSSIKLFEGVTWVLSYGANVSIADYKITGASAVMQRSVVGMANTSFEITPTNGSTIFERRARNSSGAKPDTEFVLELTNDVDHVKARMRIIPSRLYVVKKSELGEVHVDPDHKSIFVRTKEGTKVSGWPLDSKFLQISNKDATFGASFVDHVGEFHSITKYDSVTSSIKNGSVTVKNNGGEFRLVKFTNVTVIRGAQTLYADLNTGYVNMSNMKPAELFDDDERILRGPLGFVHLIKNNISMINTSVANLTLVDWDWIVVESPTWSIAFSADRLILSAKGEMGRNSLTSNTKTILLNDEFESIAEVIGKETFQVIGKYGSFVIPHEDENVAKINAKLAQIQIANFSYALHQNFN